MHQMHRCVTRKSCMDTHALALLMVHLTKKKKKLNTNLFRAPVDVFCTFFSHGDKGACVFWLRLHFHHTLRGRKGGFRGVNHFSILQL